MKFQNPHNTQFKTYIMHKKVCNVKMPKVTRAITHEVFFRIYSKVIHVIYLSIPIHSPGFKALALIAFEIFCRQDFIHIFSKDNNSGNGHNPDRKKYVSVIF